MTAGLLPPRAAGSAARVRRALIATRAMPANLFELAVAIRLLAPGVYVQVEGQEQQQGRYGVTFFQILEVVVGSGIAIAGKEMVQKVTKAGIDWARARFTRKKGGSPAYIQFTDPMERF